MGHRDRRRDTERSVPHRLLARGEACSAERAGAHRPAGRCAQLERDLLLLFAAGWAGMRPRFSGSTKPLDHRVAGRRAAP